MPPDNADDARHTGVRHLEVSPEEDGQKLLQFLSRRLGPDVPGSLLLRLIRSGQVRVDSARKKPFDRLHAGQTVRLPPLRVAAPAPEPGPGHADAASTRLAAMFPQATFTPTPAHRLDRDTSGILLAGTSYQGLRALQQALAAHTLRKLYLARVHGGLAPGQALTLRDTLAKAGPENRRRVAVTAQGKPALALARCLESDSRTSLLEIDLRTGRTHQLRVQLASRSLPIVGDRKYGRPDDAPRMMLHAWQIVLPDGTSIRLEPDW
jgi:23S rRNA pseudouridine955/2504/2580 synthase